MYMQIQVCIQSISGKRGHEWESEKGSIKRFGGEQREGRIVGIQLFFLIFQKARI